MESHQDDLIQYQIAQRALNTFGNIPGSFSLAVYLLMKNPSLGSIPEDSAAAFQAHRLLSVPKVNSAIKLAVDTYGLEWDNIDTIPDFDPLALGGAFFSIYLHHRLKKMCDKAEWDFISPQFVRDIHAAGLIMKTRYKSGLGVALIGTTALYSAFGAICALDKKIFKEYRRKRKLEKFFINPHVEQELFGCSSVMIAQELIQRFRFGTKIVESFSYGCDITIPESVLPPGARPFRSLIKFLSAVHGQAQKGLELSQLGLNPETTTLLNAVLKSEQPLSWIDGENHQPSEPANAASA